MLGGNTATLFPNPNPPGVATDPSIAFSWDNQLFPTQDPTIDGVGGLLFTVGPVQVNIFSNGPDSYEYTSYNTDTQALYDTTDFQFTLAAVPEPSSLVLAGTAMLAGLGAWARRRLLG